MNVDGASKGNLGRAGGGGIIRTCSAEVIQTFVFSCGSCNALTAELWALYHGLRLAFGMGITKLVVESDSLVASALLNTRNLTTHPNFFLLRQRWDLFDEDVWLVVVKHTRRKANKVVDGLTQISFDFSVPFTDLVTLPSSVMPVFEEDRNSMEVMTN